jgi:hypothetical protein
MGKRFFQFKWKLKCLQAEKWDIIDLLEQVMSEFSSFVV